MTPLLFEGLHWKGFLESSLTVFHMGLMIFFLFLTNGTDGSSLKSGNLHNWDWPENTDALLPCCQNERHINPRLHSKHAITSSLFRTTT